MKTTILFLAAAIVLGAAGVAQAKRVIVNGQRLSGAQISQLEQLNCARIPSGRYWVNTRSGAWGYAGSPIGRGVIGQACRSGPRHKSLSERRRLYRPGEILGGW